MPRILRVNRGVSAVHAKVEHGHEPTPSMILQQRNSAGTQIDNIKLTTDKATERLRRLSSAVAACNETPTADGLEAVEVEASATRQEIIKFRHLRNSIPASNTAACKIVRTQLDKVLKNYFDILASLCTSPDEIAISVAPRHGVTSLIGVQLQSQEWADYTGDQRREVREVRERNRDIQKVEKSVRSINAMLQEFQDLVLEQGEELDAVDTNIADAGAETAHAHVHLGSAQKLKQLVRRKKYAVGSVVGVVVIGAIVVLLIVVL